MIYSHIPCEKDEDIPERHEICPMCERPAVIHKYYARNNYTVHDQQISVREHIFKCTRCGEEWANTQETGDGLEKAYTIYIKRKNPQARKFRKVSFEGGTAYTLICDRCVKQYGLRSEVSSRLTRQSKICYSKGCKRQAMYVLPLGKL